MSKSAKRVLIAPLDWGLGHSSRCVPIVRYLQEKGHKVTVAGNEWQRAFITRSCPGVEHIHLNGYNVGYSKSGGGFMFSMLKQMPRILSVIRKENDWLIEQSAKSQFDGIISDNRYGLFHKHIPSVIMTHQLSVRTGMGGAANDLLRRLHYKYLQRFKKCWVVDVAGKDNLGGKLSHPKSLPINAHYMGLLSQFDTNSTKEEQHLLVLLSGPEPQRSRLSDILWKQVQGHKGKVVFVEGSNEVKQPGLMASHITYHKQVTKAELQPLIENASLVVCRSGYSTLMDLVALNKKAIIIPTPGQTEQAYLARHLSRQSIFFTAAQKNFNLRNAVASAEAFPFKQLSLQHSFDSYKDTLDKWLLTL